MPTLAERADRARFALKEFSTAHLNMASAAEKVSDMVAAGCFTAEEGISALASFVKQYRARLTHIEQGVRR